HRFFPGPTAVSPAREASPSLRVPTTQTQTTTFLNRNRLGNPFVESHLSQRCIAFGNECAFDHLDAVISRLRVGDNFSQILVCSQTSPDEFIKTELFRATYFDNTIHR